MSTEAIPIVLVAMVLVFAVITLSLVLGYSVKTRLADWAKFTLDLSPQPPEGAPKAKAVGKKGRLPRA